ncbi:NAD(P)/FAD-dependent oxidoreductase [Gramella sp. AN32]|uniref:NADH:ubiquinone reductase (non-electrogenic) n=1 Tax=Christiangramia antarctica TaxID=2058158 RepID=A0ABW5X9K9_9FLAO|nr:NAD(P)/FAD-dependent oxidoreductase [Gramella sp. AN32]MCM4156577.1 FAD-dependent oxidoreductase [Gramella sp. AN32]
MNIPKSEYPRVVVIGGGFAGMALAKKLLKEKIQLVLLDRHNYHTFQPLLYQVSTSGLEPDSIAFPLRKITSNSANSYFRLAEVKNISAETSTITANIGEITYDYLVIATGSKTNFFGNKSIEENGIWMKTVPQALNIRSLILENLEQATITDDPEKRKALLNFVLAGAGPTGVELSGAIAELKNNIVPKDYPDLNPDEMNIHLLEGMDRVLPPMSEKASKAAKRFLEELGVKIHLNTMVENYDGHVVTTNTDLKIKAETFIWSAGVTGAPVKGLNASAIVEKANRYDVNEFNQVLGYKNIFAIGDIALMKTEKFPKGLPMVAQPAIQQGKQLGKNLPRLIKGEKMEAFSYFDKGTMATVGRNRAVVDLGKWKFSGFFAWFVWMFVHLWFLIGFRNRIITFFNWTYNYINFDKAARLIIRPFKGQEDTMSLEKDKV